MAIQNTDRKKETRSKDVSIGLMFFSTAKSINSTPVLRDGQSEAPTARNNAVRERETCAAG